MKRQKILSLALLSVLFIVGCGNNNSNNSGPAPVVPIIPFAPNNPGYPYGVGLNFYSDNWSSQKTVTVTNSGVFREFLKSAMGVCDRMQYTGGTSNCNSWIGGGIDIIMQADSPQATTLSVTMRAWPLYNQNGTYWYQAPSFGDFVLGFFGLPAPQQAGAYLNPLRLGTWTISVVNDSKGFEARTYGDPLSYANRSLIQLRVDEGKLEDSYFKYRMGFGNQSTVTGQWFLQGTFQRCSSNNCTAGTPWAY
ncbi:MAG: hypothetical protein ACOYOK_08835 [Pseudobdellovibrionaceae bacterium]